jgi:hypothetical protein
MIDSIPSVKRTDSLPQISVVLGVLWGDGMVAHHSEVDSVAAGCRF